MLRVVRRIMVTSHDMNWTPSTFLFDPPDPLVLNRDIMAHYSDAFLPGMSYEEKRRPSVSPLFADFNSLRGRLPPALFTCGTSDCLLDDTMFMSTKYHMAGAETEVLIVPGGCHGFCMFPKDTEGAQADVAMERVAKFIKTHQ